MTDISPEWIGIGVSLFLGALGVVALGLSVKSYMMARNVQKKALQKNYPILYPHMDWKAFEDTLGSFPQYKDVRMHHYKIINRGDLDAKEWSMRVFLQRNGRFDTPVDALSFSSMGMGTLVMGNGATHEFVPSILFDSAFYEAKDATLVMVEYKDMDGETYCSCVQFNRMGTPIMSFKNTEAVRRSNRKNYVKKTRKCKDCPVVEWESAHRIFTVDYGKLSGAKIVKGKKYGPVLY